LAQFESTEEDLGHLVKHYGARLSL